MVDERRVEVVADLDIVTARKAGRDLAARLGFSGSELTVIATAISEVARNIVEYGRGGEIRLRLVEHGAQRGIVIVAKDDGPGIPNIERAMRDGFSTGRGLGMGLPGARRLMDDFEIVSGPGKGTTVTMRKWKR